MAMIVYLGSIENATLGRIWVATTDEALVAVSLWDDPDRLLADVQRLMGAPTEPTTEAQWLVTATCEQLEAYLAGRLRTFHLPICWDMMKPFQRATLENVCAVPYGETTAYQAVADRMGKPGSVRAVGQANATNPIPIIIPCHRVLGSDGKLHGYGARGGVETKAWLLRLEGAWLI